MTTKHRHPSASSRHLVWLFATSAAALLAAVAAVALWRDVCPGGRIPYEARLAAAAHPVAMHPTASRHLPWHAGANHVAGGSLGQP